MVQTDAQVDDVVDRLLAATLTDEVRPQVMVTYDEFGGYGHPDHIQAHRVATYAAALAAVPSYRRGHHDCCSRLRGAGAAACSGVAQLASDLQEPDRRCAHCADTG